MIDENQFLERYRLLSRDIQNGLQNAERQVSLLATTKADDQIRRLSNILTEINDSWQDFTGWILVGTLDDLEEARKNCAPGRLDVQSKLNRAKFRRQNDAQRNGIKISNTETVSLVIESYIPYFEQMLDLVLGNAIKYSPRGGHIDLSNERLDNGTKCKISVQSVGPIVQKHEAALLGEKGFRSEAAKKCLVTGDGYGLFNVKRLAELLGATVSFRQESRVITESAGIPYGTFEVIIILPDTPS